MRDDIFAHLQRYWSDTQIVEILGVVAMFGFLNRWNDSMATPLKVASTVVATWAAQNAGASAWSAGKHV